MARLAFCWLSCVLLSLSGHVGWTDGQTSYPICKEQRGTCACLTDQGLVDLSPLDSRNSVTPRFSNVDNPFTMDTYFYNPCTSFTKNANGCNNVAVCQGFPKANPTGWWDFGEQESATFQNDPASQKLQIKYTTTSGASRTATINLECNSAEEGKLTFVTDTVIAVVLTLTSKYACPHANDPTTAKPACDNNENCTDASLLMWFAGLFGACVVLLTLLTISIAAVHCVRALSATKSDAAPFYQQQSANFQYGTTAYSVPETVWSTKVPSNAFRKN